MATAAAKKTKEKKDEQAVIKTINDLYMFKHGLTHVVRAGSKFSHTVSKNLRCVSDEVEHIEEKIQPSVKMKEYHTKVDTLNKEMALKDEEGEFILRDAVDPHGNPIKAYRIPGKGDDTSKYGKALKKLTDEYKDEIALHDEKIKEHNEYRKTVFSFEPRMIDLIDVPDGAGPMMDYIIFMIKEK